MSFHCADKPGRRGVVLTGLWALVFAGLAISWSAAQEASAERLQALLARGERKEFRGDELKTIGMPCGGIGAGQLYVRGDGTLARWWIAGRSPSTNWGQLMNDKPAEFGYHSYTPPSELAQGLALRIVPSGQRAQIVSLSNSDFDDIGFFGEYPIAEVQYRRKMKPALPVETSLYVFSPLIPLNARESAWPVTILKVRLKNVSDGMVQGELAGWLENGVRQESRKRDGILRSREFHDRNAVGLLLDAQVAKLEPSDAEAADEGTMALALIGANAAHLRATVPVTDYPAGVFTAKEVSAADATFAKQLVSAVGTEFQLQPGATQTITFCVAWHFPNSYPSDYRDLHYGNKGRQYANWYHDAADVAKKLAADYPRLERETYLFRDTLYRDTTLPYWFVQRVAAPVSTLASATTYWWKDGRYYGEEGVGFCAGTCTHVYAYAQAAARLFPELERSARRMQDLADPAMDPETGRINFRGRPHTLGESYPASGQALDGQAGVVLRVYREHLMSADDAFLKQAWPRTAKALEYLIRLDGNDDGVIEGRQHITVDRDLWGPNMYVGGLYLAALRAGEEMASAVGDPVQAKRYRMIYEKGRAALVERLWNGKYFVHRPPESLDPKLTQAAQTAAQRYDDGCFSQQLFGQNLAHQLGLGYIVPREQVRATLESIFRYDWFPDIDAYYATGLRTWKSPYRLARKGEAGLVGATYPLSPPPKNELEYMEQVWTGWEYQLASHLIYEGLVEQGLAVLRGVHDRYNGAKHNPWNEIEGGDHYARAMASWGCLLAASGFEYDGPRAHLGFAPRLTPERFKSAFTAAEGWGTFSQQQSGRTLTAEVEVRYGRLRLRTLTLVPPNPAAVSAVELTLDGKPLTHRHETHDRQLLIVLPEPVTVATGQTLKAVVRP